MADISNLDRAIDDVEVNNADQSQPCEELREEPGRGNKGTTAVERQSTQRMPMRAADKATINATSEC